MDVGIIKCPLANSWRLDHEGAEVGGKKSFRSVVRADAAFFVCDSKLTSRHYKSDHILEFLPRYR